jgi:uncharacterized protein YycO
MISTRRITRTESEVVVQAGDGGIKPGGGFAMWLVRLGTFSRYGHACVASSDQYEDLVWIIEARPDGVRETLVPVSEYRWMNVRLDIVQRDIIVDRVRACLGRGYDWPNVLGFLGKFLGRKWLGWNTEAPDQKVFCSELVVWAYREAGLDLFPGKGPNSIAPADLERFCDPEGRDLMET